MDESIVFILPGTVVCATIGRVLKRLNADYPVFALSTANACAKAREMQTRGARIIVSHGLTYECIRDEIDVPMLELPFSGIEAALAVKAALGHSERIIHMGTRSLNHYLNKSLALFGLRQDLVSFCQLTRDRSLEAQAQDVIDAGYEVIIGGFPTVNHARTQGKVGIEFDVDEQVIEAAVWNAREIVKNMRAEEEKRELINAILASASEGLIALDEERRIFQANPAAESTLQCTGVICGLNFDDVMCENGLVDILNPRTDGGEGGKSTHVVLKELPVIVRGESRGSVVSVRKVAEIQELEYTIRKKLVLKGLVAHSSFEDIAGTSPGIERAKDCASIYAQYDSTILITGETGTGKELFAQSIHNAGPRKSQPFVAVNCAALPENLIESELFGYVRGAFTGASKEGKTGLFELANRGTIFLDEISEIPLAVQAKLLRVLQEGEVMRVGADKVTRVDVRCICSSNKDLPELIQKGEFKNDLYYRLCVLELHIPPLRRRRQDIASIALELLARFRRHHNKAVFFIADDVLREIEQMPLSGNVRELANLVERMLIFSTGSALSMDDLRKSLPDPESMDGALAAAPEPGTAFSGLKESEQKQIQAALAQTKGNKSAAARLLGIAPSTLWRKLRSA